ncbi:MAG: SDR family NAD(P)-dependent oxidoreductase [Myxococcales bacterium]|nr:SDR family NAD(P)-dependent oxidoreductase [Myxococcales bacterium]
MGKRVLVTGAAGFIGSHTSQALALRGDEVIGLDNFDDYYEPSRKRANLAEVEAAGGVRFELVEGDVRDRSLVARLFAERRFDAVVHLAAMAGVRASMERPHFYFEVNVGGTLSLLEAAREQRAGNFVFATTSSVYGNDSKLPFTETEAADRPLAPYPASKRAGELLGHSYHHLYGLSFTGLRFFTVYGPRNRPDMMAFKLLDSVCSGREIPLYNGGQMHRDWTFIEDIVAGVVAAVDRPLGYEIINLGRGEPVLLNDFVRCVEELTGRKAQLRDRPMNDADAAYTFAGIEKARRLLGYAPKTSVRQGVEALWDWYQAAVLGR